MRVTLSEQVRSFPHRHPYRVLEQAVRERVEAGGCPLDIGCGRDASRLRELAVNRGYGVDVEAYTPSARGSGMHLADVGPDGRWSIPSDVINVAYSVSVVEHLEDPVAVFREACRVLVPGGTLLILTPNLWDYASLLARVIPNRFHGAIVKATEGRAEADTFPTFYRANTVRALRSALSKAGLEVRSVSRLNTPPTYLAFHHLAWRLGVAYHRALDVVPGAGVFKGWLYAEAVKPTGPPHASSATSLSAADGQPRTVR